MWSRRSRRLTVAHRFIGGIVWSLATRVRETDGCTSVTTCPRFISRPFHGLDRAVDPDPALKCWAIFNSPLRGLFDT
jgi:hypothetical protein